LEEMPLFKSCEDEIATERALKKETKNDDKKSKKDTKKDSKKDKKSKDEPEEKKTFVLSTEAKGLKEVLKEHGDR
jgi:hypothetical protein